MQRFVTRPLYLLVRDALVQRVISNEWKPGSPLPNEFELAREMGVSIGTIRKSLDELERERVLVRRQGRGTFVADHSSEEFAIRFSSLRDPAGNRIHGLIQGSQWTRVEATPAEIARMQLRPGAEVLRVTRTRTFRDHAFAWDRASLPAALFPKLPADVGSYRISIMAQSNNLLLSNAVEEVSADLASAEDAQRLAIPEGTPILQKERRVFTENGKIAEWRTTRCYLRETKYIVKTS